MSNDISISISFLTDTGLWDIDSYWYRISKHRCLMMFHPKYNDARWNIDVMTNIKRFDISKISFTLFCTKYRCGMYCYCWSTSHTISPLRVHIPPSPLGCYCIHYVDIYKSISTISSQQDTVASFVGRSGGQLDHHREMRVIMQGDTVLRWWPTISTSGNTSD